MNLDVHGFLFENSLKVSYFLYYRLKYYYYIYTIINNNNFKTKYHGK